MNSIALEAPDHVNNESRLCTEQIKQTVVGKQLTLSFGEIPLMMAMVTDALFEFAASKQVLNNMLATQGGIHIIPVQHVKTYRASKDTAKTEFKKDR